MGGLSPTHWLIVVVVVAVLFGARRLPDAARGLGRSLRIFKTEISSVADQSPRPADHPLPPGSDRPAQRVDAAGS
jgi:sec-independent protein translocase protein TatA